ncbi:MAG: glycosyltransferase family 4 protein [bacterium]
MTKILYFITQSEFGGAQRYVFDLANNLKADFKIAVAFGESKNNLTLAKILAENNIEHYIIPSLKRNLSPINDILALLEIIKLIKNYQPDIIHLNSSKISILGSLTAFIIKLRATSYELRVIYTVHGWVFNEPLHPCLKYFYLYAEKFTAGFKNKIICVSEYDKRMALKYKIAPAEKLITIHNGLTPVNFYSKEEAQKKIPLPAQAGLTPFVKGGLLIGSIGNLYKTKGFEYLIEAANILTREKKIPATFIIIGEGDERKNLENLIKKYNLENNFILAGRIDEAARFLPAFDIYACSSVKEGLSYTLIEAMQAGLPIVATEAGGNQEMIINNKTGLIVKPADAQNLANALQKLISDKNLAAELGAAAKQSASQNFNLEKMIEKTRQIYL